MFRRAKRLFLQTSYTYYTIVAPNNAKLPFAPCATI